MGRLPSTFAGLNITFREPFSIPGELIVPFSASGVQFPDATFLNSFDRPFEIHRMIPRVTGLDANNVILAIQPSSVFDILLRFVRVRIQDVSKDHLWTRAPTLLHTLIKGQSEATWELAEPLYLKKAEQLIISVDTLAVPAVAFNPVVANLRIELTFQGFHVTVAPPSEAR